MMLWRALTSQALARALEVLADGLAARGTKANSAKADIRPPTPKAGEPFEGP